MNAAPELQPDLIVIGAGPAGENLAQYAGAGGSLNVALIEQELLGGECSYYACMPSKALLRPVEIASLAAHLPGVNAPTLNSEELLARRDDWVSHYDDAGQVKWAEGAGLRVVRGRARITGEREVTVETATGRTTLRARRYLAIATGSVPVIPNLYASAHPWGSRDATGVREVPGRVLIVGGGVVACESAIWLAALGSTVTMLVRGDRLLPKLEPFVSDFVVKGLREKGIDVRFGTTVTGCERDNPVDTGLGRVHGGEVRLTTVDEQFSADEVLLAIGRRPALDDLGLDSVGLTPEQVVDGPLPDWLLAVGDASGEPALTHWGKYRARVLGETIATGSTFVPDEVPVPQVVFTDPPVAAVGRTERDARRDGFDVVIPRVPFTAAAGAALLRDDIDGTAQLVVDQTTGTLLGATFVGPEAGELLHAATVAILAKVPVRVLRHAVPSYPTASELWLRLLEELPVSLR